MRSRVLLSMLGFLTILATVGELPSLLIYHEITGAYAGQVDNPGNHYGWENSNRNHDKQPQGNGNSTGNNATSVPEPATGLLIGAGIAALAVLRRRMKK
jgi:hypothetical protein